jgi:hypothetical protein
LHGREAWCALEILRATQGRTAVIATEVKDNPGTSITNACEHLAYWVCVEFSINPSDLIWIEHYGYPASGGLKPRPRTYDLISFDLLPAGHDGIFAHPKWRPMGEEDWLVLGLEARPPGP